MNNFRLLLVLAILLGLLVACGGDDEDENSGGASANTSGNSSTLTEVPDWLACPPLPASCDVRTAQITPPVDYLEDLFFSANGRYMLLGEEFEWAGVWDLTTGQRLSTIASENFIRGSVDNDGTLHVLSAITSGEDDAATTRFELISQAPGASPTTQELAEFPRNAADAIILKNGVIIHNENTITLYNYRGEELARLDDRDSDFDDNDYSESADGRLVAIENGDQVFVFDTTNLTTVFRPDIENYYSNSFALSPDGRFLALAYGEIDGDSGYFGVWNIENGERVLDQRPEIDNYISLSFCADGQYLGFASARQINVFALDGSNRLHALFETDNGEDSSLACSPDSRYMAFLEAGTLQLFSLSDGSNSQVPFFPGSDNDDFYGEIISFSPDGFLLISEAHDYTVNVWAVPDFENLGGMVPAPTASATEE